MGDDEKGAKVSDLVDDGVSLLAIIEDMKCKYVVKSNIKPKYLIISPDFADNFSECIRDNAIRTLGHSWRVSGGEKYSDMVILIMPGQLKFIEVAG